MIIGLAGLMGSGKDTVANIFVRRFEFEHRAFADPIRRWAEEINPIVDFDVSWESEDGRSVYQEKIWRYNDLIKEEGYERAKRTYPELRRTLQKIGAAGRKLYGRDHWVNIALKEIKEEDNVVFSDVRTKEEADAIWNLKGSVALVNRAIEIKDPLHLDETEQFALSLEPDGYILNFGSLLQLELHVVETYEFLLEEK